MKRLIALVYFLLAASPAWATLPTGLPDPGSVIGAWDMASITGSTLNDVSGNGNNGTINGASTVATGLSFNGSSNYVTLPSGVFVSNANYTAIVCWESSLAPASNGILWAENLSGGSIGQRLKTDSAISYSGNNSITLQPVVTNLWHCSALVRNHSSVTLTLIDSLPSTTFSTTGSGTSAFSALGAQQTGASSFSAYYTGIIGYALIWKVPLSQSALQAAYLAIRPVLEARGASLPDFATLLYPQRIWQRQGVVFDAVSQGASGPFNYYVTLLTTGCALISSPCIAAFFDNQGTNQIGYAESPNGTPGSWTKSGSLINGLTGQEPNVTQVTGFSYSYIAYTNPSTSVSCKDFYTANAVNGPYTKVGTSVLCGGTTGTWDATGVANFDVVQQGTTLYGAYEGYGSGTQGCGTVTSTNGGSTWTKSAANPVTADGTTCFQPWLQSINSTWYMWTSINTAMMRWQTTSFGRVMQPTSFGANLGLSEGAQAYSFTTFNNDAPDESNQLVFPWVFQPPASMCQAQIDQSICTDMFYQADDSSNVFVVKLAVFPGPITSLVQTGEGEASATP